MAERFVANVLWMRSLVKKMIGDKKYSDDGVHKLDELNASNFIILSEMDRPTHQMSDNPLVKDVIVNLGILKAIILNIQDQLNKITKKSYMHTLDVLEKMFDTLLNTVHAEENLIKNIEKKIKGYDLKLVYEMEKAA